MPVFESLSGRKDIHAGNVANHSEKVRRDSLVYSDALYNYNLFDVSEFKHFRINHSKLLADKQNHINGIEDFLEPGQASYEEV